MGMTHLRLVHLMEDVPYLDVRHAALNQYPWGPAVRQYTLVRQTEPDQERRDMPCEFES